LSRRHTAPVARKSLNPAEHRAYRELYASCRQLINRWRRLAPALEGTAAAKTLEKGSGQIEELLAELGPTTASYGLHGRPTASVIGARIAGVRSAVVDRAADTGMVVRFAVLDVEHVATLLTQLTELARARKDDKLAEFCETWGKRIRNEVNAMRRAAVTLGSEPQRAAAPLDDSLATRATHRVGWVFGSIGEAVDRLVSRRRR
jgi:hypothetical protein